jgi:hypothetical protein
MSRMCRHISVMVQLRPRAVRLAPKRAPDSFWPIGQCYSE